VSRRVESNAGSRPRCDAALLDSAAGWNGSAHGDEMNLRGFSLLSLFSLLAVFCSVSAQERASTAQPNVHVLPPLHMPGLDRERTLRIYLPPGYKHSKKRYAVLYMHDGQNLFDDAT